MDFKSKLDASYRENRKKWVKSMSGGNVSPEMAEDIIQQACVNALEMQNSYDSTQPFDDWFYGILSNARIDIINAEKRQGMVGKSS